MMDVRRPASPSPVSHPSSLHFLTVCSSLSLLLRPRSFVKVELTPWSADIERQYLWPDQPCDMVGTIEPRLIAPNPFNDPSWEIYLPPLQYPDGLLPPSRPVIHEPLAPRNNQSISLAGLQQNLDSYDGEAVINQYSFGPNAFGNVQQVLQRPAARLTSSQSLRKILADETEPAPTTPRKRQRKDEFVKLPQPEKKQKGSQQVVQPLVPPIIVGIHEPPPNQASKFRPINPGGPFRDLHGRSTLNTAADETGGPQKQHIQPRSPQRAVQPVLEAFSAPQPAHEQLAVSTVRAVQPRNKWTEEETRQLLLGVQKHGIGNWKRILDDKEFTFNNRKAVHIKDRFRTCFPDGYGGQGGGSGSSSTGKSVGDAIINGEVVSSEAPAPIVNSTSPIRTSEEPASAATPPKKGRSHRKDRTDLTEIGIIQPFSKSNRRQRRAFTEEEDRNILNGFEKYGQSSWTAIQRDPTLRLQSRKPTDLRDRFRNRYPEKHKEISGDENRAEPAQAILRTVVSIDELLGPSLAPPPSQPQPQAQPQPLPPTQAPPPTQTQAMQDPFLPPISFQFPTDILSTNRLPKMSFTELLSGPLPAMDVPGDPYAFPDWTESMPFAELWMPETQGVQTGTGIVGGVGRQNRSVYDISSIIEAVQPYGANGIGG